ncbi:PQQ-binding-like beta-propeller repeat protein [Nocardiopsis sp. CC223A]|uniref:outer membrane protein assembly factor BamB family protein n=1 Tax=Nocardiopsis sp. CC223A TaxID=3044051 RepID=UPI0027954CF9|nr:PQQ-binding-like beta-propeller repeat protein [Nocardiopsis sp. CC223A]
MRGAVGWSGAGLAAGAGLLAGATALTGAGAERGWGLAVAAVACLLSAYTIGARPEGGRTAAFRAGAGALALAGAAVAVWTFPADSLEAFAPADGLVVPSRAAVRLWAAVAAVALGALLSALAGPPASLRPLRRSLPGALAGALPVLLAGALVGPVLFPAERHTVAGAPEPTAPTAWTWEPPGRVAVREVLPGDRGPLVLLGDGAVALDGAAGEPVWEYRRPHPGLGGQGVGSWGDGMDVWSDGGRVYVAERSGPPFAVLDAATGAVTGGGAPSREDADALDRERREAARTTWEEAVAEPSGCHRGPGREVAGVTVGLVGCADGFADLGGLVVEAAEARFVLVAVDPDGGRELWRREWEGARPSFAAGPAAGGGTLVVLEAGDGSAPVGLDPVTGEEVLLFPGGGAPDVLLQADTAGLVAAFEEDGGGLLLRRSAPDGEVTAEFRAEGVRFDDADLAAAAVTPDAVFLPVREDGGRSAAGPARILRLADRGAAADLGVHPVVDVLAAPGWAVAVLGDEYGPTGLRSLAP